MSTMTTTPASSAPAANNGAAKSSKSRTIRFRIKRADGPGKPARWEEFDVPTGELAGGGSSNVPANIIACLQWIAAHPTTREGKPTTPIAYESGCLEEVCGSCTMLVNGKTRQSCSALIDDYAPRDGDTITLEPMSKFPVVRDLWVDRSRLFHNLKQVRAWVPIDGTYDLGKGPTETPEHQQMRYKLSECMSCGCCLEACPQYTLEPDEDKWDTSFVGAAVISQARYFNEHATGATLKKQRLDVLAGPAGVANCGNSQNCVKVCPKEIPLTESIGAMGRAVTVHKIKEFFSGR